MSEHPQGLNASDRAILALDLEPSLQEAAHANQQWGGKNSRTFKDTSGLTEAQAVDVRSKIATEACLMMVWCSVSLK